MSRPNNIKQLIKKYRKIDIWWFVGLTTISLVILSGYHLGCNLIEKFLN